METNPKDDELQNVQSEVETTAVAVNDVDESTGPICALPEITETEPEKSSEANDVVVVESVDMIHDSMADVRDVESEIVNSKSPINSYRKLSSLQFKMFFFRTYRRHSKRKRSYVIVKRQ